MIDGRVARWLALVLLLGTSCRATKVPVAELVVSELRGDEVLGLTRAELEQRLTARLEAAGFALRDQNAERTSLRGWHLQLSVAVEEAEGVAAVHVALHAREGGAPEGVQLQTVARATLAAGSAEAAQGHARDALDRALAQVVREARMLAGWATASDGTLEAALRSADEIEQDVAVRLLVQRRNRAAVPTLLKRLELDDIDRVREAVGQLVELRASEAVNRMIDATRRQGPVVAREIVFAVAAIGGDDAEAYLDLVASGHDDALVRAAAEAALRELRTKRSAHGGTP